jgi:hypothetical protein
MLWSDPALQWQDGFEVDGCEVAWIEVKLSRLAVVSPLAKSRALSGRPIAILVARPPAPVDRIGKQIRIQAAVLIA